MRTTTAIVFGAALLSIAGSATGERLFDALPSDERRDHPSAAANASRRDRSVLRSSRVRLNRGYFQRKSNEIEAGGTDRSTSLELELPSGESIRLRLGKTPRDRYPQAVRGRKPTRRHWSGRVQGEPGSHATFIVDGEKLIGTVHFRGKVHQVRPDAAGVHRVTTIDPALLPEEAQPLEATDPAAGTPAPEPVFPATESSNAAPAEGAETKIDVLVVYTDVAKAGSAEVLDEVELAVIQTNDSYANSGIHQRIQRVGEAQLTYAEQGDIYADLGALKANGDGVLDEVHVLRDEAGADLVVLVTEAGGHCGLAYTMNRVSLELESFGFAVVKRSCLDGYYTFAHELGHLMGARHDRYDDGRDDLPFPYNHGYVDPGHSWRTVMAIDVECEAAGVSCERLPKWSNPESSRNGTPMGIAAPATDAADNRSTLNATAATVSQFRGAPPPDDLPPPLRPPGPPVLLP